VIGTVRGEDRTGLHDLADALPGRVRIEQVDITDDDQLTQLRDRLADIKLDLLFVNAGIADPDVPAGQVSTKTFTAVMVTNALAPMHAIEILEPLMNGGATIGVMSSRAS
jgi:NAD(P)-dependent dehydrogenase (short-subunit alcohol dehydrogenase family)